MDKLNAAARGKPGAKCGCATAPKKKPEPKPAKNDKKMPPWLNKKAK